MDDSRSPMNKRLKHWAEHGNIQKSHTTTEKKVRALLPYHTNKISPSCSQSFIQHFYSTGADILHRRPQQCLRLYDSSVSGFATPPVRRGVFSLTPPPPNQVRSCDYCDQKSTDKRNPLLLPNQLLAQPLTGQEPRSQRPRNTQAGHTQMKKPSW